MTSENDVHKKKLTPLALTLEVIRTFGVNSRLKYGANSSVSSSFNTCSKSTVCHNYKLFPKSDGVSISVRKS